MRRKKCAIFKYYISKLHSKFNSACEPYEAMIKKIKLAATMSTSA